MNYYGGRRRLSGIGLLLVVVLAAPVVIAAVGKKLPEYKTKYYVLYTDLDRDMKREAAARITAMAEEYYNRTKSFSGVIRRRFSLYLYRNREDYARHPGIIKGSAGIYNGKSLVATAPPPGGSWGVVQHEGFHQFADKMIRGRMPIWLNEGLAEYFGGGIWTGDDLVVGVIPPWRLARLKKLIQAVQLLTMDRMLTMSHREWNEEPASRNYDQAWSMVHFLVHAENGKYQKALSAYIRDMSRRQVPTLAFAKRFGRNLKAFRKSYAKWWTEQPKTPTVGLYEEIKVRVLAGFLARAQYTRKWFKNSAEFFQAAEDGTFDNILNDVGRQNQRLWLPPSLLVKGIRSAGDPKRWSLTKKGPRQELRYAGSDGMVFTGTFTIQRGKNPKVKVVVTKRPPKAAANRQ
ncbi:MAG: DUF1570 domain-containing protein [Phycisphaerae bacterium]|nr:DUF1570 domain-containing protein [Phycisphaerae bacterium]MDP7635982.1 DUF1570 domain-containing protein [Phycisphaerae bacterium]